MKRICLAIAIAAAFGCHPRPRTPLESRPSALPQPETPAAPQSAAVTVAGPHEPQRPPVRSIPEERGASPTVADVSGQLEDAFFDYDRAEPGADALAALHRDADLLRAALPQFPNLKVVIEGHCDERGSAEYNLALGARRAARAARILREFGLPAERAETITFGKEAPQCTEAAESCWRRNRRAHLVLR